MPARTPRRGTPISGLIAVAVTTKTEADGKMAQLTAVAANDAHFKGHQRTYEPVEDGGLKLPDENQKVRVSASEVLALTEKILTRKWDLIRTLDEANAQAYGDITVDGETLLEHVPVGHLLWLAREVDALGELIARIPVRDPARDWTDAPGAQVKSEPVVTTKSEKVPGRFTLAEATQFHPAQVQRLDTDKVVGNWTTVTFSGALDADRKQELIDRVIQLRDAVKQAREQANTREVEDQREANVLFGWLYR